MGQKYYMEVRGSMTRFEPLTGEAISRFSEDGLTLEEIAEKLAVCGLSMEYVVHDPSRAFANTFYADTAQGFYIPLYLSRQYLSECLNRMQLEKQRIQAWKALEDGEWVRYYHRFVPVPMLIYDFQLRYQDIPANQLFHVWHSIYKRIDYSNGMWRPDILEAVFSNAPSAKQPPVEANGRVTLYRGMGTLSQPPEQAISWSTHPGNALWFAIHCGQGTKIAVARVWPEDIVAYDEGFQQENEVILRPGTEMELSYEDMIPVDKETIPFLFSTALPDFMRYGRQVKKLRYPQEDFFRVHGITHILRVLFLSLLYFHNAGDLLTEEDKQILIYFSLLHDIGRTSDGKETAHGAQSVELIHKQGIRLKSVQLSRKDYRIAELLILCHCLEDQQGISRIHAESGLSLRDKKRACKLYEICKDMDGLDRVRFNGLDYRRLRTKYARRLPLVAGCLLQEPILEVLENDRLDGAVND